MCIHSDLVLELKEAIAKGELGNVIGGHLRTPLVSESEHGGFYFYAQHLVHVMCELFGYYPNSVDTFKCGNKITVVTHYDSYDITGIYLDNTNFWIYSVGVAFEKGFLGGRDELKNAGSREFHSFYNMLKGEAPHMSYDELFAPVFIMNAIARSLESGHTERIHRAEEIQ